MGSFAFARRYLRNHCCFLFLRVLRCFTSPGVALGGYGLTPPAPPSLAVGCPIRRSTDQSVLAAPRGLSQLAASFVALRCQGIRRMPVSACVDNRVRAPVFKHGGPLGPGARCGIHLVCGKIASPVKDRKRGEAEGHCMGGLVGVTGVGPVTSSLSGTRSNQLSYTPGIGGGNRDRTGDFRLAKPALCQLSYAPVARAAPAPARGGHGPASTRRGGRRSCVQGGLGDRGSPELPAPGGWCVRPRRPRRLMSWSSRGAGRAPEGRAAASLSRTGAAQPLGAPLIGLGHRSPGGRAP